MSLLKKLITIYFGILILSGNVPDKGYVIINGKIKIQENTQHIVKIEKNKITVTAK